MRACFVLSVHLRDLDYTIDGVDLSIQPSTTVLTGEKVTIGCKVRVSHANIPNLTHIFQIKRDGTVIHSSTTTEDSIAYELNPARAADSGVYVCRVAVKEKNKASPSSKLEVSGKGYTFTNTFMHSQKH